jgi:hypothetical protein
MGEDGKAAVFVGTFLSDGTAVSVCDEHLVMFCASTLHTMTGIDPLLFIAAISEDDEPGEAPENPPEPPDDGGEEASVPVDPTPPTKPSGRMRAVSSIRPGATENEPGVTTADAARATPAG